MTKVIQIRDIADHDGEEVTVRGWVYNRTGKGRLQFILLRDGSGQAQCVAFKKEMDSAEFDIARALTQESSVVISGTVRADERAPGIPGGFEIGIKKLQLVQQADEYPITPKEHGTEFLMNNRHLWVRSNRQWAILRIRATIIKAMRDWLDDQGFLLVDTPIITPAAGEETTTLFEVDYFGESAFLAQTGQLYNEANIMAFGKVYCFGPTFRAEKSKTRRHLIEFWMLEPEIAFCSLEELMDIEESMVCYVVEQVLAKHAQELAIIERDLDKLRAISAPFARISYDDAVARLQALQTTYRRRRSNRRSSPSNGAKILAAHMRPRWRRCLTSRSSSTTIRRRSKPFYMTPVAGRPEVCRSVDLLGARGLRRDYRRQRAYPRPGFTGCQYRRDGLGARSLRMVS